MSTWRICTLFLLSALASCSGAAPDQEARAPATGGSLVASVRSEPRTFNRYLVRDNTSALVSTLTQAKLVRIDAESDHVEPWLAESWTQSEDGLTYTISLRDDVRFSDGVRFTAADVVFSFEAAYDAELGSPLGDSLRVQGQPLAVSARDDSTIVITFPVEFGPGLRLLDNLPMFPAHRLRDALRDGSLASAWGLDAPLDEMAGLGVFAKYVVHSEAPGNNGRCEANPRFLEGPPNAAPC